MNEQKFIASDEDLRTAIIAALIKNGGTLDVNFEELGEATTVCKLNTIRISFERTSNGARYRMVNRAQETV